MVGIDIIGRQPDGKGSRHGNWRSRGEAVAVFYVVETAPASLASRTQYTESRIL